MNNYIKVRLPGAVLVDNAVGYALGATSMHIDGFSDANGLIKGGSVFKIVGSTTEYTISSDALISTSECTIAFTPALVAGVLDNAPLLFMSDITDTVVQQFNLVYPYDYVQEAQNEIEDLAERLGVFTATDIEIPLAYTAKRYAIAFLCKRLCQDKMGLNNTNIPDTEKYAWKYEQYSRECEELKKSITYEMLTGDITYIKDRAITSGHLFRSG